MKAQERIFKRIKENSEIYETLDKKFGQGNWEIINEGTISWSRCYNCQDYTKRTYTLQLHLKDERLDRMSIVEPCPFCGEEGSVDV